MFYKVELYNPACEFMLTPNQILKAIMFGLDCASIWYTVQVGMETKQPCPECQEHTEAWRKKHPCHTWTFEFDEDMEEDIQPLLDGVAEIFGCKMELKLKEADFNFEKGKTK